LSWTASTDNVGVTGYQVFRCTGTCTPTTQLATSATNSYTDTSVSAGTTYSYLVKATDAAANVSAASNTVTTTVPSGTSLTISNISATAAIGFFGDTAQFKWSTNVAATGKVMYGTSPSALTKTVNASTANTSQAVSASGLSRQTTYYYQISATANATTVQSTVLSFVTP
ncbi:fibronectin type III domain-containing protein, partial [Candidatus Kaiserbacteria bacterium]|nr:fibronectin type III domain-containing protein [Candidatus Kaiserbacteria bacterium]